MTVLPEHAYTQLAPDTRICRVLNGMWQVSGAHGLIDPARAIEAMHAYHDAGFSTWDLADHYGPAEDFVAAFRQQLAAEKNRALAQLQAFTKWVPNPGPMSRSVVERAIDVSLRRMGTDRLDLLQFHWWDYDDPRYLDALRELAILRDEGRIKHLALTNFDTGHLERILDEGIEIVSNQVQYSLVDMRPERRMVELCTRRGVTLLTYGTVCGGLLSDRYLGRPEPGRGELTTASLQKYKRMIDIWGGWEPFQQLLRALRTIADRHNSTIANVAVSAILDRPTVAGVIVGVRLGVSEHLAEQQHVFDIRLDAADWASLDSVLEQGRDLMAVIGDCGDEYRR